MSARLETVRRHLAERTAGRLRILRLLGAAEPWVVATMLVLQVALALVPVGFVLATSAVVGRVPDAVAGGLDSPEWRSLRNALLVAGALFLVQQLTTPLHFAVEQTIIWRVDRVVRERVASASFAPVGIEALEDVETADGLGDVIDPFRGYGFPIGSACSATLSLVGHYLQWAVAASIVGVVYTWWAAVATAFGSLVVRVGIASSTSRLGAFEGGRAPQRRLRDYYRDLLIGPDAAKEVRVFGLLEWLRARYRSAALAAVQPVWAVRRKVVLLPYAASAPLYVAVSALATIGAARAAARGELSLGEFVLVMQAIVLVGALGDFFHDVDFQVMVGMWTTAALERFEGIGAGEAGRDGSEDPGLRPEREIRFERVSFRYPGGDRLVLRDLDLTIPAGRSLAIVGLNGAGKTTLVKLLARLYEPEQGRITVDGVDVRAFAACAWRRRIGAIFQDFVHYDLPLADNVGFGAPALLGERERIRAVLERAGGRELLERLPDGLETVLSRSYEGGSELSGGQWQRVAIARALMAVEAGAGVLVLDEPTANLDVRAEAAFFDSFLDLTQGLTTILISHRFSTVRRADRIVVVADGAVVEEGTHEELLAVGGRYAELFRLQASRFAETAA